MKKVAVLIISLLSLVSCTKDDTDMLPQSGQYVCDALGAYFSAVLSNGKCVEFTVYTNGEYFGSWDDISSSGKYPNYKYTVDGMDIDATFSGANSFNAMLKGVLRESYDDNNPMATGWLFAVETTNPVQFHLDNKVLDANGDGVLDTWQ